MERLSITFILVAIVLLFIPVVIPAVGKDKKAVFFLIIISTFMFLYSRDLAVDANKGKPISLNVLTAGEKYEILAVVVDGGKKYLVVKSLTKTNENQLKFIGPLNNLGVLSVGEVFIKTAEDSLEKVFATLK